MTHNATSGVAHFITHDDADCLALVRELLSFMPQNNHEDPPRVETPDPANRRDAVLDTLVPVEPDKPYDMKDIIQRVVDDAYFLEVHEHFAQNLVVGFARLGGQSVGIVANQPAVLAGCLDINASDKGARFIRFCDAFNIPIVTFEDVPGFLPGTQQELGGIITIITRKSYGGAYCVMGSKHVRTDVNLAYPTAEIAVMGPEGAVNIVYRRELQKAEDPETLRRENIAEFRERFANPYIAAERGWVDAVIQPRDTRPKLINALRMLESKRDTNPPKKHGNIPL
jgi:propionyl-CoA carboxylase beta chain